MRNAALVLGLVAGLIGMIVGFAGFGYVAAIEHFGEVEGLAHQLENPDLIKAAAIIAPMLALAGGAMAHARALWGGVLMLVSAAGMYHAFGFNVFTMFPVAFACTGGILAL
ncbi:hypothetical protein AB9K41_10745, partial [Cribrihabitans sp. XS_ASV171]